MYVSILISWYLKSGNAWTNLSCLIYSIIEFVDFVRFTTGQGIP